MLLSLKHRFLFVHIAKTGGTSVRATLARYRYRGLWGAPMFIANKLDQMSGHRIGAKFPRHAKAIAAREMLPATLYDELFKFVFVRNPWDLQVSSFFHIRKERPQVLAGVTTFEQFIRLKFDPERPWNYLLDTSRERQRDYVVDLRGQQIVDFIGHYESLQADFDTVCDRIGLPRTPLPHRRKAQGRDDFRRYYNDETARLVEAHYREDIEMFGYRFDG
ncbi:sulfotransferase family 2 domain-containing protein [Ectothiorhodospira magna]|nr:sulfotransferase family 2 domain-containing protein [Ectothiorhodospira magna]